jgi:hypothetical protein
MVPYLVGYAFSSGRHFMWLGYNLDDSCVYLSWMRQAADGSHRVLNMFTTEAQHGREANPLFLALGIIARVLHLPLLFVLHASRIVFGGWLLAIVWLIIGRSTSNVRSQKLAFLFVCYGSGLGWIPGVWPSPIDAWQPEAITFLSLYLSPLFCFSLALQALSVLYFVRAVQTVQVKYAILSGIVVFILGLTHTYDVVTMLAVFGTYAFVCTLFKTVTRLAIVWIYAGIVALISAPSVLYVYHELQTENVFRLRMEVRTASGPFWTLAMGYGLLLAAAVYASIRIATLLLENSNAPRRSEVPDAGMSASDDSQSSRYLYSLALIAWMGANIAVSYLPLKQFPFQRKMLQGAHIPIAILAGVGTAYLISRISALKSPFGWRVFAFLATALLSISNLLFMQRDIESFEGNLIQTTHMHRPYLSQGEMEALEWIEHNTPPGVAVQPLPWVAILGTKFAAVDVTLACFTPALTGRPVYCGHWGETPDYARKLAEIDRFGLPEPRMTDELRVELLRKMRVQYLVFSQKQPADSQMGSDAEKLMPMFCGNVPLPTYLKKVYSNPEADVYHIQLP